MYALAIVNNKDKSIVKELWNDEAMSWWTRKVAGWKLKKAITNGSQAPLGKWYVQETEGCNYVALVEEGVDASVVASLIAELHDAKIQDMTTVWQNHLKKNRVVYKIMTDIYVIQTTIRSAMYMLSSRGEKLESIEDKSKTLVEESRNLRKGIKWTLYGVFAWCY